MVQQDIAVADGAEHVGLVLQRLGQAGPARRVLQVVAVHAVRDRQQAHQVDRAIHRKHLGILQAELVLQEAGHLLGAVVRDFEPHGIAKMPLRQLALQRIAQVLDFFLVDEQFTVAGDAELIAAAHAHAGKQLADVGMQDGRKEHEAVFAAGNLLWQQDHAGQGPGRLHDGRVRLPAKGVLAFELHGEVQALVEHARKRMRRVQANGGEHRHQFTEEIAADPLALFLRPVRPAQEADPLAVQVRDQHFVEQAVLFRDQLVGAGADKRVDLPHVQSVRAGGRRRLQLDLLLQAGNADFEELVQVAAENTEEAQSLQQRDVLILGLGEHAPLELQLAGLTVQEELLHVGAEVGAGAGEEVLRSAVNVTRGKGEGRGDLKWSCRAFFHDAL